MYAIQKLALKMAPHVVANPSLLVPALIIGGIALVCEALDWIGNRMQPYMTVWIKNDYSHRRRKRICLLSS